MDHVLGTAAQPSGPASRLWPEALHSPTPTAEVSGHMSLTSTELLVACNPANTSRPATDRWLVSRFPGRQPLPASQRPRKLPPGAEHAGP